MAFLGVWFCSTHEFWQLVMTKPFPHNLIFRRGSEKDAPVLIDLAGRVATPKIYNQILFTNDDAVREINKNVFYFLEIDGQAIGSAAYRTQANGSVYINNFAVDPRYQRRGIARAALEKILKETQNVTRLELCTHPDNVPALNLYMSYGFVIESRVENYFGDGEPRLILAKTNKSG